MKLQPALIFGAHMVLQRRQLIVVWGKAADGDRITVRLGDDAVTVTAEAGDWRAELPAREAETGLTMTISAAKSGEIVTLPDVAVGEVWLAGGQSNMAFLLKYDVEAPELVPSADDPLLRCFDYPKVSSPLQTLQGHNEHYGLWRRWDPENAPWFCAVGYYFAAQLRKALDVPVGILACNYDGTPAAAWTSMETLQREAALQPVLENYRAGKDKLDWEQYLDQHRTETLRDPTLLRQFNDRMFMGTPMRELFEQMEGVRDLFTYPRPLGPFTTTAPAALYDNMLTQVAPYGVRGIIWYQGEEEVGNRWVDFYDVSLKSMWQDWCRLWGQELPLLQVMLAPYDPWQPDPEHPFWWPDLRQKQRDLAEAEPMVFCANIMDGGHPTNIHPRDKRSAGERLSLLARRYVYGEALLADSPTVREAVWESGRVTVRFDHAEGLHVAGEEIAALQLQIDGVPTACTSRVEGERLIVESDGLQPDADAELRYAWENYCTVNCYNAAQLPVFPFLLKNRR